MQGILGTKVGMTQIFGDDGTAFPVTIVKAGPCLVVQRKTADRDGYHAVQLGLVEERPPRRVTAPMRGHFDKSGIAPTRLIEEFAVEAEEEWKAGDQVGVEVLAAEEYVDVTGRGKGKGFQGVVKRHGFAGGRATHGSMFHRAPGSIGQASDPSRVFPGTRLPGQTGGKQVTVKNLRVVRVDEENGLLYLKGAVPGPRNGYVAVRRAKRG